MPLPIQGDPNTLPDPNAPVDPNAAPPADPSASPVPPDPQATDPNADPNAGDAGPAICETQQASPQEQDQYSHFVAKAYELIYDAKTLPKIIDMLHGNKTGDDQSSGPMEGLARATALIVGRVAGAAEQAGETLTGDVVLHAGTEVFEDLANLSKVAKIKDYSTDRNSMEGAYFRALDIFRGMLQSSGEINQPAAAKDLDKLIAMDKAGQLEQVFQSLARDGQGGDTQSSDGEAPPAPSGGQPMPSGGLMQGAQ